MANTRGEVAGGGIDVGELAEQVGQMRSRFDEFRGRL